jgi:cell division protein FtsI/penicillin-binding protein 2/cell division protein FtsW (lipid II flippase)
MAVTKSWESSVANRLDFEGKAKSPERQREFWPLLGASLLVACGLVLVFTAKTQDFPALQQRLDAGDLVDINSVQGANDLLKTLFVFSDAGERAYAADRVWEFLVKNRPLPNAGSLSRIRLHQADTVNDARARSIWERETAHLKTPPNSVSLFPVSKVKPFLVVRTPKEFLRTYIIWGLAYIGAFWVVHIIWRLRRFRGDPTILPVLHLLTGMGFILMVSLRDPLRDTLEFRKFAWGSVCGCILLLLPLLRAFQYRVFARWVYTPLFAAVALFGALLVLGSGPTGSDAKVNLGPFQPVELIKILIVMFLAGFFAANWERLRDLHQKAFVPKSLRGLQIPRLEHTLPVILGVSLGLVLFFVLKDMGPALVMGFVFMTMFAVARARAGLPLLGIAALLIGVTLGVHFGTPHTVVERVAMWLSPWDNDIHGGDQLAHSLWAFATGGPIGSGPGWGDPSLIPAGHTDLVLASIAEEWGLPGVVSVCLLFSVLVFSAFRIALKAPDEYATFLGVGLGSLIALEMLLVSGGALGAIPLSGVVSPFLSSGNTAMLSNYLIFAVLLGISNQSVQPLVAVTRESGMPPALPVASLEPSFRVPVRVVSWSLALCAIALLCRATYIEVFHDRELLAKDTLVYASDGVKRPQHNPRLNLLAAEIPRGNIYDRNGVLLATSSWAEVEKRRADYQKLGISIDSLAHLDSRLYPFGPATAHLLGDLRTGEKFHASNSSLIEHDSNPRLQGYATYEDLAPVVRVRHQRGNPILQELLSRDRDVHSTIDVRLQLKASDILRASLQASGKKGALVVMNAQTGDVLALASYPEPPANGPGTPDQLLDRARYGEYPPGSTFKLVTAIAALRLNPKSTDNVYKCTSLGDGRVGTIIPGWRRPIRDDIGDHAHGSLNMANAITVSCNAYFAQLGVFGVGPQALHDTAAMLGIPTGSVAKVKEALPFCAYGQGTVLATPFKMARVAATIAAAGQMPEGRWVTDPSNSRTAAAQQILDADSSAFLQRAMRSVVTNGTARASMAGIKYDVAGKTGTAQLDEGDPHSWFAGYAPYSAPVQQRLAFAVVVEHGGYGAKFAAPIARQLVEAAGQLNLFAPIKPEVKENASVEHH